MQHILIKGHAGMSHMFWCINQALNLSDYLKENNIDSIVYHDWRGWENFHEIYNINHDNFTKVKFINNDNLPIVTANTLKTKNSILQISEKVIINIDANGFKDTEFNTRIDPLWFLKTVSLTSKYQNILNKKISDLNQGNYIGVHFRGSDVCTNKNITHEDFLQFCENTLNKAKEENLNMPILLASDNQNVLVKYVDNKQIFTNSIAYDLYNKGVIIDYKQTLHSCNLSFVQSKATSIDLCSNTALDFFLLINSKKLYADEKSGFGQITKKLHRTINKKHATLL